MFLMDIPITSGEKPAMAASMSEEHFFEKHKSSILISCPECLHAEATQLKPNGITGQGCLNLLPLISSTLIDPPIFFLTYYG
jgi:hypothetical protein